jgi:hypothetical protein
VVGSTRDPKPLQKRRSGGGRRIHGSVHPAIRRDRHRGGHTDDGDRRRPASPAPLARRGAVVSAKQLAKTPGDETSATDLRIDLGEIVNLNQHIAILKAIDNGESLVSP